MVLDLAPEDLDELEADFEDDDGEVDVIAIIGDVAEDSSVGIQVKRDEDWVGEGLRLRVRTMKRETKR